MIELLNKYKEKGIRIGLDDTGKNLSVKGNTKELSTADKKNLLQLKPELIQFLEIQRDASFKIPKTNSIAENIPLTPNQRGIWIHDQIEDDHNLYVIPVVLRFELLSIDLEKIKSALKACIDQNDVLRFVFDTVDGTPYQKDVELDIEEHFAYRDISSKKNQRDLIQTYVNQKMEVPFEFTKRPPWTLSLFKCGPQELTIFLKIHHLIADGESIELFFDKLLDNCSEQKLGQIQFRDYAHWINNKDNFIASRKFWRDHFDGFENNFAFFYEEDCIASNDNSIQHKVSKKHAEPIFKFLKERRFHATALYAAAIGMLISKRGRTNDFVIGIPAASRTNAQLETVLGDFVNMIPLRLTFDFKCTTGLEKLTEIQQQIYATLDHQLYPLEYILENFEHKDRQSLFNVTLSVIKNIRKKIDSDDEIKINKNNVVDDLAFTFLESEDEIEFIIDYDTNKFKRNTIVQIAKEIEFLLVQFINEPTENIAEYQLLEPAEKSRILAINQKEVVYPFTTVLELFENVVDLFPNNEALSFEGQHFSYKRLDDYTNQMSNFLLEEYKICQGDKVGLKVERGEWMIVAMYAVLKTGAVYVPIDPSYPAERINLIEKDSSCKITIDNDLVHKFKSQEKRFSTKCPNVNLGATDLAYIIYTSGSTGTPKGVQISHLALADYVQTTINYFGIKGNDKVIQQSSISFDVSVEEIFPCLSSGAKLIISKYGGRDLLRLVQLIEQEQITILSGTPLLINELNKYSDQLGSLRILISGGDELKGQFINNLLGKTSVFNTYGPTESTVCATYYKVQSEQDTNIIGTPIQNRLVYVVDKEDNLVPQGVVGELLIAGNGLSEGYLNQPELTAEKFISNLFNPKQKVYRSGDLVYWDSNFNLRFKSRNDNQIKIRGFRIELGEIEHAILNYPGIEQVLVLAPENSSELNERILVAYLIAEKIEMNQLDEYLTRVLPAYMIPSIIVELDDFPLTTNGKLDLKVLLDYKGFINTNTFDEDQSPKTQDEKLLASIWQEVLGVSQVGINDDFFRLGGHSLLFFQIYQKVKKRFQKEVDLTELYAQNTILKQLKLIHKKDNELPLIINTVKEKNKSPFYITYYWHIAENFSHGINISFALVAPKGKIESNRLNQAFKKLCEKHTILNAFVRKENEGAYFEQLIDRNDIEIINSLSYDECIQKCNDLHLAKFNFREGPLIKGILFNTKCEKQILYFSVSHLIFDGYSLEIFWKDLFEIYSSKNFSYKPLQKQFTESGQLREMNSFNMEGAKHWNALKTGNEPIAFFEDRYTPEERKGIELSFKINKILVDKMTAFCKAQNISFNSFFLILISLVVHKESRQKLFTLCFDHHSRTPDTIDQIGCWVQHIYLQVEMENYGLIEFLKYMSENIATSIRYSNVDILKVFDAKLGDNLKPELRNLRRVRFNYYEEESEEVDLDKAEYESIDFGKKKYLPVYFHFRITKSKDECLVNIIGDNAFFSSKELNTIQNTFMTILDSLLDEDMRKQKVSQFLQLE